MESCAHMLPRVSVDQQARAGAIRAHEIDAGAQYLALLGRVERQPLAVGRPFDELVGMP